MPRTTRTHEMRILSIAFYSIINHTKNAMAQNIIYLVLWPVIWAVLCWAWCQPLGQLGSDLLEARAPWLSSEWLLIPQQASLGLLTWGKQASRRMSSSRQSLSKPRLGTGASRLLPHAVYQSKSQGQLTFKRSVKRLFLAKRAAKSHCQVAWIKGEN